MKQRWFCPLLLCVVLWFPAQADAFLSLKIPFQVQFSALSRQTPQMQEWAGELGGSVTLVGFTGSVGLGYVHSFQPDARGMTLRLETQLRPLYFTFKPLTWKYLAPFVSFGLHLGGVGLNDALLVRAAGFVGAGLDIGLTYDHSSGTDYQFVLKVQYQYVFAQTPDFSQHRFMVGLGWRAVGM